MNKLRKLRPGDIAAIKDDLVESGRMKPVIDSLAQVDIPEPAFTFLKDGVIVACCGAAKVGDAWEIWALYSKKASYMTRFRAVVAFRAKLKEVWKKVGGKAVFNIPSDIPNGRKYANFIGAKWICSQPSILFKDVVNDVYEVI